MHPWTTPNDDEQKLTNISYGKGFVSWAGEVSGITQLPRPFGGSRFGAVQRRPLKATTDYVRACVSIDVLQRVHGGGSFSAGDERPVAGILPQVTGFNRHVSGR